MNHLIKQHLIQIVNKINNLKLNNHKLNNHKLNKHKLNNHKLNNHKPNNHKLKVHLKIQINKVLDHHGIRGNNLRIMLKMLSIQEVTLSIVVILMEH